MAARTPTEALASSNLAVVQANEGPTGRSLGSNPNILSKTLLEQAGNYGSQPCDLSVWRVQNKNVKLGSAAR